jgi:transcriptional regulator with XRE-family HTH domain
MHFGMIIRRARVKQGWSLVDFADHTGMNRTYLSGMEKGSNMLSIETLLYLSRLLGIAAWEVVKEVEEAQAVERARAQR